MNKTIILALSLLFCVSAQHPNGTGLNSSTFYGYIRLQSFEAVSTSTQLPDQGRFMIMSTYVEGNTTYDSFNVSQAVAGKYLMDSNNVPTNANLSNNDLFVKQVNLSDRSIVSLIDNHTGNMSNPFDFFFVDPNFASQQFKLQRVQSENCQYFIINASKADNTYEGNCATTVKGAGNEYNYTLKFKVVISMPRALNVTDKDSKYQARLTINNSILNEYQFQEKQSLQQEINFPFLVYTYNTVELNLYVNAQNKTQNDKECNLSATYDIENGTVIDPCFSVQYEGSKTHSNFVQMYYCANLDVNNFNESIKQNKYGVQGNFFEFTQDSNNVITVKQLVSESQLVTLGRELHSCPSKTTFGKLLSGQNLMIIALVFVSSIFA